jgi:transformation/transcription domain-associated protein
MEVRAHEHVKELMDSIRARPTIIASNIERFVLGIGTKFIARPEERLLNVVHSLLQRCYQRLPLPQNADVPEDMKKDLETVCDACLSQDTSISWRRRGIFEDVRESFVGDVQPQRTTNLKQLMDSLKVRVMRFKQGSSCLDGQAHKLRLVNDVKCVEASLNTVRL